MDSAHGLDPEELLLEYHRLVREDVLHEDERRWTLFGAFLIAEALLASLLRQEHDAIIGLLGMVSSALIGLAIWRNNVYLRDRSLLAADLECLLTPQLKSLKEQLEEKVPDRAVDLRFYDEGARLPSRRLARQRGYGLLADLKKDLAFVAVPALLASAVMRVTILLAMIAWGAVVLISLHVDIARTETAAAILGALVLTDWIAEALQRLGRLAKKPEA